MVRTASDRRRTPGFLFTTCQVGAEPVLKAEMARDWPQMRFAFSRPGFLTFKLPEGHALADDFDPHLVFARAYGFSLGQVAVESSQQAAAEAWRLAGAGPYHALHVWQRDTAAVGYRGFEPHATPAALAAEIALREARPDDAPLELPRIANAGDSVLDCVLVEAHQWWIGRHRAGAGESRFPGGLRELVLPEGAVSRAHLKMQEALAWSELPIRAGQKIVELGCSPGGASQALLERGLIVIGVDPAKVDPRVAAHPNFTHLQKRGADVRRRVFRGVAWLAADMNVAPDYTLDTVEAIVTHPEVNIRGLLLTLKLLDWKLAAEIPHDIERVRRWGYGHVRVRQLAHNRQEVCLAATRRKRN